MMTELGKGSPDATPCVKFNGPLYGEDPLLRLLTYAHIHWHRCKGGYSDGMDQSYLVNGHAETGVIVRGTPIVDIGGIASYRNACEEEGS